MQILGYVVSYMDIFLPTFRHAEIAVRPVDDNTRMGTTTNDSGFIADKTWSQLQRDCFVIPNIKAENLVSLLIKMVFNFLF